jgi:hypothetical protein
MESRLSLAMRTEIPSRHLYIRPVLLPLTSYSAARLIIGVPVAHIYSFHIKVGLADKENGGDGGVYTA